MALPQVGLEAVLLTDKFIRSSRQYDRQVRDLTKKTNEASDASKRAAASAQKFDVSLAAITATTVAVAAGVIKVVDAMHDLAAAAAPIADARRSFVALAAESGISASKLLADLQEVTRGTVDSSILIQSANRALIAGGADIANELPRIFEIASAAARATGQDLGFVVETLTKGIIKASPLLIDNAEVYIQIGSAVDDYAASLGKATEDLTQQERQLAVLNAVLEQGGDLVERFGDQQAAAADQFRRTETSAKQLSQGIGELLIPAATRFSAALDAVILGLKGLIAGNLATARTISQLGAVLRGEVDAVELWRTEFTEVFQLLSGGIPASEQAAVTIRDVGDASEEAGEQVSELADKVVDLQAKFDERLAGLERQWERRWEDILIGRRRQIEDAERSLARRREDIARSNQRRLEDIERTREERLREIRQEQAARVDEFQREANRRREQLEENHQERLFQIQTRFQDTVQEAARRNDAVAVAQALRTRARELRDAGRARETEQRDLGRDLTEKRRQLQEEAAQERQDAQIQYQQALEDLRRSQAEQEESLRISLARQREDRLITWQRQKEDFDRQAARQLSDLDRWYAEQQAKLQENLTTQTSIATEGIDRAANAMAAATVAGVQRIAQAALSAEIGGAALRGFQRERAAVAAPRLQREIGGPALRRFMRAEGGLDVVSAPTSFTMGEAGPEAVLSVPLQGQMNVNHRFSPLNVGVDGVPGGMDMGAVQSMMYSVFKQIGQDLLAGQGLA
jgi:hypothetical protein